MGGLKRYSISNKSKKEDFIKYVLPQNKYADISMTTISRGLENVSFDIYIKTQYF